VRYSVRTRCCNHGCLKKSAGPVGYCSWAGFLRIPARTRTTNNPHFIWRCEFRQDLKIRLKLTIHRFASCPMAQLLELFSAVQIHVRFTQGRELVSLALQVFTQTVRSCSEAITRL